MLSVVVVPLTIRSPPTVTSPAKVAFPDVSIFNFSVPFILKYIFLNALPLSRFKPLDSYILVIAPPELSLPSCKLPATLNFTDESKVPVSAIDIVAASTLPAKVALPSVPILNLDAAFVWKSY